MAMGWGLESNHSLTNFSIGGRCEPSESFPPLGLELPSGVRVLHIHEFPNLESFDPDGFRELTSLQELRISSCPKLQYMPGWLPDSLTLLEIQDCPLLKIQLERRKGKEWNKIDRISFITIDGECIK